MSDNEYEKRCSEYNGEVYGFYFILTVFVFGLVCLTAVVSAYLDMWWMVEILEVVIIIVNLLVAAIIFIWAVIPLIKILMDEDD